MSLNTQLNAFIVFAWKNHCSYIDQILDKIEKILIKSKIHPEILTSKENSEKVIINVLEEKIKNCDFGIVIIDSLRPNIIFEYGLLRGMDKPIIFLISDQARINIINFYEKKDWKKIKNYLFKKHYGNPKLNLDNYFSDRKGIFYHNFSLDSNAPKELQLEEIIKTEIDNFLETGRIAKGLTIKYIISRKLPFESWKIERVLQGVSILNGIKCESTDMEIFSEFISNSESVEVPEYREILEDLYSHRIISKNDNGFYISDEILLNDVWENMYNANILQDYINKIILLNLKYHYYINYSLLMLSFNHRINSLLRNNFDNFCKLYNSSSSGLNNSQRLKLSAPFIQLKPKEMIEDISNEISEIIMKIDQPTLLSYLIIDKHNWDMIQTVNEEKENINELLKIILNFAQYPWLFERSMNLFESLLNYVGYSEKNLVLDFYLWNFVPFRVSPIEISLKLKYIQDYSKKNPNSSLIFKMIETFCLKGAYSLYKFNTILLYKRTIKEQYRKYYKLKQKKALKLVVLKLNDKNNEILFEAWNLILDNLFIISNLLLRGELEEILVLGLTQSKLIKSKIIIQINKILQYKPWGTNYSLQDIEALVILKDKFVSSISKIEKLEYHLKLTEINSGFGLDFDKYSEYLEKELMIYSDLLENDLKYDVLDLVFQNDFRNSRKYGKICALKDFNYIKNLIIEYLSSKEKITSITYMGGVIDYIKSNNEEKYIEFLDQILNLKPIIPFQPLLIYPWKKILQWEFDILFELLNSKKMSSSQIVKRIENTDFSNISEETMKKLLSKLVLDGINPEQYNSLYSILLKKPIYISVFYKELVDIISDLYQYKFSNWKKILEILLIKEPKTIKLVFNNIITQLSDFDVFGFEFETRPIQELFIKYHEKDANDFMQIIKQFISTNRREWMFTLEPFFSKDLISNFSNKDLNELINSDFQNSIKFLFNIFEDFIFNEEIIVFYAKLLSLTEDPEEIMNSISYCYFSRGSFVYSTIEEIKTQEITRIQELHAISSTDELKILFDKIKESIIRLWDTF